MARVKEKELVSKAMVQLIIDRDQETQNQFIRNVAMRRGFYPAKYGFYNPEFIEENGLCYAVWEREDV